MNAITHPVLVPDVLDDAWAPCGESLLPVSEVVRLVSQTVDLLDVLAQQSRTHGRLTANHLYRHDCGQLAWASPVADAEGRDEIDDLMDLGRMAATCLGIPESSGPLMNWVHLYRLSVEVGMLLTALGVGGGPPAPRREIGVVSTQLYRAVEPYTMVVRITMDDNAICKAERNRLVGMRRRFLLGRQQARDVEEYAFVDRSPTWSDLVALCERIGRTPAVMPEGLEAALP